jgi:hypothetical protein
MIGQFEAASAQAAARTPPVPCQNSFMSADQATHDAAVLDRGGDIDGVSGLVQRRSLLQARVRPVTVVVPE